jgi:hypothetical protein
VQEHVSISPTRFGVALDPGPVAHNSVGMEAVAEASLVRLHAELRRIHITRINCYDACTKLFLAYYANIYTESLEDYLLGYVNVNPWTSLSI